MFTALPLLAVSASTTPVSSLLALPEIKQLDIGVLDAIKARGVAEPVNTTWQILEHEDEDFRRISLKSRSYRTMDARASSRSHLHHQVLMNEDLVLQH